ncbi:MAG: glucose-6-phosphate isomerase, partial [Planctomycetes bacterium]|nr:glucose-6-phosphate isomerase [Planctomycetota bacterium]
MWDWVGGRTSVMSAVGLLPAALEGLDIRAFLTGAKEMDQWTRESDLLKNPAGLLSAAWYIAGQGKGRRDMVLLPYKDRLELFSRYLQQLIMESIGKRLNLKGEEVNQGIAVYGNKGSTDQHAYVQQLRDGLDNFFVTFIEVLRGREGGSIEVDENVRSGDYLEGFYLGTREALHSAGRQSLTLTIEKVDEVNLGRLIALFERAVGFYASYVDINAYHQPGVEAGKLAATRILEARARILADLDQRRKPANAEEIGVAAECGTEVAFKLLEYLSANPESRVERSGPRKGVCNRYLRKR